MTNPLKEEEDLLAKIKTKNGFKDLNPKEMDNKVVVYRLLNRLSLALIMSHEKSPTKGQLNNTTLHEGSALGKAFYKNANMAIKMGIRSAGATKDIQALSYDTPLESILKIIQ